MDLQSRAIGCLLGQIIGDTVGTLCEFEDASTATERVDRYIKTNGQLSLSGSLDDRPINLSISDDSEMALALARSLIRQQRYDVTDVTQSYVTWFNTDPIDIGGTTQRAFGSCNPTYTAEKNHQIVTQSSHKRNSESLSNGCLMRISPLGITSLDRKSMYHAGCLDCQITNPHPLAQEAVCTYLCAIRTGLETGNVEQTIQTTLKTLSLQMGGEGGTQFPPSLLLQAINDPIVDQIPILTNHQIKMVKTDSVWQGHLGITLYNAFYELQHTDDFMMMLKNIMSRGGDTDTNCAVSGALFGAVHGYEKIPVTLINEIMTQPYSRHQIYPWGQTEDLDRVALSLVRLGTSSERMKC
jgi:ADP-ribosylglycohydrolase